MPRPGAQTIHPRMLGRAQAWASAAMVDACTVTRAGAPLFDAETNEVTAVEAAVYEGRCVVQDVQPFGGSRVQQAGGQAVVTAGYFAAIPHDAAAVHAEDVFTVTASADPQLQGRRFRVAEVLVDTFHARRRLILENLDTGAG